MGDRGQTATLKPAATRAADYSRWEIGGKPQLLSLYPGYGGVRDGMYRRSYEM